MKRITYKTMLTSIKNAILAVDPTAQVILFGSRARRTARKDSDWDVLILVDRPQVTFKDSQAFRHNLVEIELDTNQSISVLAYARHLWHTRMSITPLYQNILKEGIVL